MRLALAVLVVLTSFACAARPGARTGEELARDDGTLQAMILAGIAPGYADPCHAGPIWAVVDDDRVAKRLDDALAAAARPTESDSRTVLCRSELAAARIIRLARVDALDLEAELAHELPLARRTAVRYVAIKKVGEQASRIRELLSDPDRVVQLEAFDAVVALDDQEARPRLVELAGEEAHRALACRALRRLGDTETCGEEAGALVGGRLGGTATPGEWCQRAQEGIASEDEDRQIRALLYYVGNRFRPFARSFGQVGRYGAPGAVCELADETRWTFLKSEARGGLLRGLMAAVVSWERHPVIGEARSERVVARQPGLERRAGPETGGPDPTEIGCFSDVECVLPERCLKTRGQLRGACGVPVDSTGTPLRPTDPRARGCSDDLDCPPTMRCARTGTSGVCVAR